MENQQQFEFCHRMLEEVMWGRVEGEEEEDGGGRKRGKKWKLFRRRKKDVRQKAHCNWSRAVVMVCVCVCCVCLSTFEQRNAVEEIIIHEDDIVHQYDHYITIHLP